MCIQVSVTAASSLSGEAQLVPELQGHDDDDDNERIRGGRVS